MLIYVTSGRMATTELFEFNGQDPEYFNDDTEFMAELENAYAETFVKYGNGNWPNRGLLKLNFVESEKGIHVEFKIPNMKYFNIIAPKIGTDDLTGESVHKFPW